MDMMSPAYGRPGTRGIPILARTRYPWGQTSTPALAGAQDYGVNVAVSKKRDTKAYKVPRNLGKEKSDNPKWLLPVALTSLVLGPVWIVVYYVSKAQLPIPGIYDWNLGVGFVFMAVGMVLLTRWK